MEAYDGYEEFQEIMNSVCQDLESRIQPNHSPSKERFIGRILEPESKGILPN